MLAKRFFFLLFVIFLSLPVVAEDCSGGGSEGCWVSACVFTPEGLFIDGKGKDGWRRTEYIFPETGPLQYRMRLFLDDKCSVPAPDELPPWTQSDTPFKRTHIETPLESTRIEHVTFGPLSWGKQANQMLKGRFTVTDNVRLCFSRNLPFAEDGPAYDLQPLPDDGSGDVSSVCLDRVMTVDSVPASDGKLDLPGMPDLIGMEVPPYPLDYDSWQGSCVEFSSGETFGCTWTLSILSAVKDAQAVGVFAAQTLRYDGPTPIVKVTDYLEHPNVPENYVFAHYDCELDGKADAAVMAAVKQTENEWFAEGLWARRLNTASGKFEELDPKRVRCIAQGMGEGHLPEDGVEYLP